MIVRGKKTKAKLKVSKKKDSKIIDKTEIIKNAIRELDNGNIAPARNYLNSLLKDKFIKDGVFSDSKEFNKVVNNLRVKLVKNSTAAEKIVFKLLKKHNIEFEFQKYINPTGNKFYFMDFFFQKKNICVEIDGGYHLDSEQVVKDIDREKDLNSLNIRVVRFKNEDVFKEGFINEINKLLI